MIRLGKKYLSLEMIDEALYLAFKSGIPQLLTSCKNFTTLKTAHATANLISLHEEKVNPGQSSSLIKAMS